MVKSKIKSTIVLGICFTTSTSTVALGAKDIRLFMDDSIVPIAYHENKINNEDEIENLVRNFGEKLQLVSLLAPKDIVSKSIEDNYSKFISYSLLERWKNDPQNAPGRITSSPWPDRIEIKEIKKVSEDKYQINGEIIEVTSVEKVTGGFTAKQAITILVVKDNDRWFIDEFKELIVYKNTEYSFEFNLPESWEGYTIVNDEWEGNYIKESQNDNLEVGPRVSIRHPKWTTENQRQDIPIMIFTIDQWNSIQKSELSVSGAPIPPKELGRNDEYVFALPARYNYGFLPGYEEVENILENDLLEPIVDKN